MINAQKEKSVGYYLKEMLKSEKEIFKQFIPRNGKKKNYKMSKRIQRLNELIKREVSQLLLKEIEFPKDALVTVTRVQVSADLNQAKIYISVIPEKYFSRIFQMLNKKVSFLQNKIKQLLIIKKVPKIKLVEEKETQEAARIEELLEEIKKDG